MVGRELYYKARELLYRGLLASDRLFYRPDAAAQREGRLPRAIGVLVPINTPEGSIAFSRAKLLAGSVRALGSEAHLLRFRTDPRVISELADDLAHQRIDLVLLPGSFDIEQEGLPQLLLELIGVPHTGSSAVTARLCADKALTKRLASSVGVATAAWRLAAVPGEARLPEGTDFPVIVKPRSGTSSIGVHVARDETELRAAVAAVLDFDPWALIEEQLVGQEVTVGVVGGDPPRALGVIGFAPGVLTTAEKTGGGQGAYQEPAEISPEATRQVQGAAEALFDAVDCRGVARIDFVWTGGRPVLLEINAVPGLFARGTLASSARLAGLDTTALLTILIEEAQR